MAPTSRFVATVIAFVAMSGTPDAAMAERLPLTAAFGNKDGCVYALTGESSGSDDFFLLTADAVTTATSYCEIGKILNAEGQNFQVEMTCESEGETGEPAKADITRSELGYSITFTGDQAVTWGPLPECK